MKSALLRIVTFLQDEPAMIGTGLSILMTVGAAFGLDITDDQRDALLMLAGFIGGVGAAIRSQVKPMAKVRREMREGPRSAELDPRLFGRKGKGRR